MVLSICYEMVSDFLNTPRSLVDLLGTVGKLRLRGFQRCVVDPQGLRYQELGDLAITRL